MTKAGIKVSRQASKNPRKNNKKVLYIYASSESVPEVVKPNGRAAPKKAPTKKVGFIFWEKNTPIFSS